MAAIEGHYASCERAESHSCACGVCGGALHGWTGAVKIARDADPQRRQEFRRTADDRWDSAFEKCRTPGRATFPKKAASMDSIVADIVDLLADDDRRFREGKWRPDHDELNAASPEERGLPLPRHAGGGSPTHACEGWPHPYFDGDEGSLDESPPSIRSPHSKRSIEELRKTMESGSTLDQVEALATGMFGRALDDVAEQFDGDVPHEVKKALADHYWCDFLANTAKYVARFNKLVGVIPDRVAKWISDRIIEWRRGQEKLPLEDAVIRTATKSTCKTLVYLTKKVDPRSVLLVVRIVAILACKSPERHRAVTEYCVDPICKHLTAETRRRLVTVIEQEWLPAIQESAQLSTG